MGDEMNAHVCQSIQTAVELKYLAAVSRMIISPSENKPIIGPAQDNLVGLFKITDENVFFSQQEVMNMLVGIEKFSGIIPEPQINDGKILKWTGKQIYSMILPPITYYQKSKKPAIKDLIIEEGIVKQGQIEKGGSTAIVHQIFNDYGHKEAARYLNDLQKLITRYMVRSGFSVGISDLIVAKEIRKKNEEVILQGKKEVVELTKKMHLNILADFSDGLDIFYEQKIKAVNQKTEESIRKSVFDKLPMTNRINYIVSSGSKGADINIQQMMCLVGQQSIDQQRVPMGFTDRTLPHYPRYENGAESRGFITSNFLNGLNPQEFFFHAMAGREGVIDTAVKTANSGYLQRKLVKSMEDLKVAHDFSVRGSNNDIVQFCYGYDGFDSIALEIQKGIDFIKIDIDKLNRNYYLDSSDKFEYVQKSDIDKMKKIDKWKTIMQEHNKNLDSLITEFHIIYTKFAKIDDIAIYHPVNFNRLILNTTKQFKLADVNKADIHPIEIILEIRDLIKYCTINGQRNIGCEVLMWNYLSPKILLRDKKFNRVAFMHIINAIKSRYKYSLAEGGEMVGPLAAQSLGEKTTQMTLHSVDWETEIIIAKNGKLLIPKIGEFIDDYYNECLADPNRKDKIQYINDGKQIYIPLDDGNDWKAYSCDENGKVMWTKLEAITRHPVVNEDGSETILEVKLECGRKVKATKGKSFLIYNEAQDKVVEISGDELQVGHLIPVCEGLELDDTFTQYTHIDVKDYLLATTNIPAKIELTEEFGYFIGAYLANGIVNEYHIIISKDEDEDDDDFIKPIKTLMKIWDIGYRYVKDIKKECISVNHIFQSTQLADLLSKIFGKTSNDKVIPTWILQTPIEFQRGIITGYFSGDGSVSIDGSITASSVGKSMIQTIGLLLNKFNISWTMHKTKQDLITFPNAKEFIYNIYININKEYNKTFEDNFKLTIAHKALRLHTYNLNITPYERLKKLNEVILRKVIKINEVLPSEKEYKDGNKRYVYDLTVEKTRNFVSGSLINLADTFHLAGVGEKSAVTQGVPRLGELLANTKNPKNNEVIVYLDEDHRYNHDLSEKVRNNIELTKIKDILESTAIYLEPNNDYDNILPEDREFMEIYRIFSNLDPQASQIPNNPWVIRFEFDRRKIIDKKITMEDINLVLKTQYPTASMMFMDDNASKLVFRLRLNFQSNLNRANDDIILLEDKIKEISDVVIKGIDNIISVWMPTDESKMAQIIVKENGSFTAKREYTLITDGTNLFDILLRKGVDATRTYSNDPNEMYSIFGIETARFQIQYQLNEVLLGTKVEMSPRHLDLLCDKMCQHGEIMSVSRHGIKKENIGPLAKASFEETTDQLLEASLFGAFDNIKGVSSNIMVGQIPTCGTGDSTLLIDEDLLNTQEDIIPEEEVNIEQYFKSSDYCNAGEIKFSLNDIKTDNIVNANNEYDNYMDVIVE